jgi:hypothetical protein
VFGRGSETELVRGAGSIPSSAAREHCKAPSKQASDFNNESGFIEKV